MVKVELDEEGMAAFMTSPEMGEAVLALILYCCACFALRRGKGGRKA